MGTTIGANRMAANRMAANPCRAAIFRAAVGCTAAAHRACGRGFAGLDPIGLDASIRFGFAGSSHPPPLVCIRIAGATGRFVPPKFRRPGQRRVERPDGEFAPRPGAALVAVERGEIAAQPGEDVGRACRAVPAARIHQGAGDQFMALPAHPHEIELGFGDAPRRTERGVAGPHGRTGRARRTSRANAPRQRLDRVGERRLAPDRHRQPVTAGVLRRADASGPGGTGAGPRIAPQRLALARTDGSGLAAQSG